MPDLIETIMIELKQRRDWNNPEEVEIWFEEKLREVRERSVAEERERVIEEINNTPIDKAHTYSSENADEYRTFDNGQESYKQKLLSFLDEPNEVFLKWHGCRPNQFFKECITPVNVNKKRC